MKKYQLIFLVLVVALALYAESCNILSLPNVAGTWDLTFYVQGSNCPAVISPAMSNQVWIIQQNDDQVTVVIQSVDGKTVNFEFAVNATLQADGNFSFNETFYQTYRKYYLRMNVICNATMSGSTVSGSVQLSLQDQDTMESCVEYGNVEGTRRASN
jgi:hypothetical protein